MSDKELAANKAIVDRAKQILIANAQQYTRATLPGWLPGQDSKHDRLYKVFGLPEQLTFQAKKNMYDRNGFVKGAINKLTDKVWQDNPEIIEGQQDDKNKKETPTEKEFAAFAKRTKLWRAMAMADRYRMVGNYSALIVRIADGKDWSLPVENLRPEQIIGFYPVWEDQLEVSRTDDDRMSDTYGEPLLWNFKESCRLDSSLNTRVKPVPIQIHANRVFYMGDVFTDGLSSESGNNLIAAGYNSAYALFKVLQAGAEGSAKNSMRQIHANFDKDADMRKVAQALGVEVSAIGDAFQSMGEDLNTFLDAFTVTQGVEMTPLTANMSTIDDVAQWNMNEFCAAMGGIPSTELTGTLTGDRASTENAKVMAMIAGGRREQVLNNDILDLLAMWQKQGCWQGVEFDVVWTDLLVPSPLEKVQLSKAMADVNSASLTTTGVAFDGDEIRVAGGYEPTGDADVAKEVADMSAEQDAEE